MFNNTKTTALFIFVFCNLYNPFSIYITLFVNVGLIKLAPDKDDGFKFKLDRFILACSGFIFLWVLFLMILQLNFDLYVFGKYLRNIISAFCIMVVCSKWRFTLKQAVSVFEVVFFIHVFSIGMQFAFPQLDIPMAQLFGFRRETTIISDYTIRKLGCSTSYDTAAMLSVSAIVLYFLCYIKKQKWFYVFLALASLAASTKSSRIGMILGIVFFAAFSIYIVLKSKGIKKVLHATILLFGVIYSLYSVFPVLAYSTELFDFGNKYVDGSFIGNEYTHGTATYLTGSPFKVLGEDIVYLFLGHGIDPNKISGLETDIGYVKIIYHIGIIGFSVIMLLYLYILTKILAIKRRQDSNCDEQILIGFFILYLIIVLMFNYKSLELYSRGSYDLVLMIFFVLTHRGAIRQKADNPRYNWGES